MALILVCDDDAPMRSMVVDLLARAGHRALEAADGRQALDAVWTHAPDLVLCDVFMPEVDGVELLRALDGSDAPPPVIAMSGGFGPIDMLPIAECLGAVATISKPFAPNRLLDLIAVTAEARPRPDTRSPNA